MRDPATTISKGSHTKFKSIGSLNKSFAVKKFPKYSKEISSIYGNDWKCFSVEEIVMKIICIIKFPALDWHFGDQFKSLPSIDLRKVLFGVDIADVIPTAARCGYIAASGQVAIGVDIKTPY